MAGRRSGSGSTPACRGRDQPGGRRHGVGLALGVHPDGRVRRGLGLGELPAAAGATTRPRPGDGTFTGNLDTTGCATGPTSSTPGASWHDSFGQSHSWLAPAVEVTVGNPPRFGAGASVLQPQRGRQEDTARVNYCLSTAATVKASVTGEDGSPVRTLEPTEVTTGSPICYSWNNSVAWDGKDDAGKVVAAGTYTLKLHAVDAAGRDGDGQCPPRGGPARPGLADQPGSRRHGVGHADLGVHPHGPGSRWTRSR